MFISGYANTENVFYCLNAAAADDDDNNLLLLCPCYFDMRYFNKLEVKVSNLFFFFFQIKLAIELDLPLCVGSRIFFSS